MSLTALGAGPASDPPLSCIDTEVRSTCALAEVTSKSLFDSPTFIHSCVGLNVMVGEGLWPFKRWLSPRILSEFTREPFLFVFTRQRLRLEGDPNSYGLGEIFCPAEAVDSKFVPSLRDQLADPQFLRVGDIIAEGDRRYLIDGLFINQFAFIHAILRDQATGQTIARTLN